MIEQLTIPRTLREAGMRSFTGAAELRPPAGQQVLFFSVEPYQNLIKNFSHTVDDPQQDIYPQWTARAHNLNLRSLYTVHAFHMNAPMPVFTRFAGILGGGGSAMVTQGHDWPARQDWQTRFEEALKLVPAAQIPTLLTCYSMQAFIKAHDAEVDINASRERKFGVGQYKLTPAGERHWLFAEIPRIFPAFRSHSQETKPESLPEGFEVLAVGAEDDAIAAVAYGDLLAAIQFHNDLDAAIMGGLSITRIGEIEAAGMSHEEFLLGLQRAEPAVMQTRNRINGNFFQKMHEQYQQV